MLYSIVRHFSVEAFEIAVIDVDRFAVVVAFAYRFFASNDDASMIYRNSYHCHVDSFQLYYSMMRMR